MPRWVLFFMAGVLALSGCGGKPRPDRSPTPSAVNLSLPTALHAVELARGQAAQATGVARISLSFARPGGRAEFWSIILADPSIPEGFRRVDVQGTTIVDVAPYSPAPGEGAASFAFDQLKFDSSRAESVVSGLDWTEGASVTLPPVVLDALRPPEPQQVRGSPAWHVVVIRGQSLVGSVFVSAANGQVLYESRADTL